VIKSILSEGNFADASADRSLTARLAELGKRDRALDERRIYPAGRGKASKAKAVRRQWSVALDVISNWRGQNAQAT